MATKTCSYMKTLLDFSNLFTTSCVVVGDMLFQKIRPIGTYACRFLVYKNKHTISCKSNINTYSNSQYFKKHLTAVLSSKQLNSLALRGYMPDDMAPQGILRGKDKARELADFHLYQNLQDVQCLCRHIGCNIP